MKTTIPDRLFNTANGLILTTATVLCVYPLLYVFFASISDPAEIAAYRGVLLKPLGFSFSAYKAVLANPNIAVGYGNTLFLLVFGTSINLLLTSFGAYALSRKNLLLKSPVMFAIAFTMLFNGGLIPNYLLVRGLGLVDSRWALIVPTAISAWNLVIMRTAFAAIPDSLEESAKLDGANDFQVLFKIVLPLSTAVVAVMVLFYGVSHWNAWFNAAIYLRDRDLYPLQLVLREILIQNSTDSMLTGAATDDKAQLGETIKYATIIVSTLPILLIYPLLQKYFVKGVMVGAIKG